MNFEGIPPGLATILKLTMEIDPQDVVEPREEVNEEGGDHILGVVSIEIIKLRGVGNKVLRSGSGSAGFFADAVERSEDTDDMPKALFNVVVSTNMWNAVQELLKLEVLLEFKEPLDLYTKIINIRKGWIAVWREPTKVE